MSITGRVLVVLVAVFIMNWLSRYWIDYPFLYCWFRPVGAFFHEWRILFYGPVLIAGGYAVWTSQFVAAIVCFVMLLFLDFLPHLVFSLIGGACE